MSEESIDDDNNYDAEDQNGAGMKHGLSAGRCGAAEA